MLESLSLIEEIVFHSVQGPLTRKYFKILILKCGKQKIEHSSSRIITSLANMMETSTGLDIYL